MRRSVLVMALVLSLSAPAAQALDSAQCGEIEGQVMTLLDFHFDLEITQSPASTARGFPGGCTSTDLDIYAGSLGLMFRVEMVRFSGADLLGWVRGEVVLPSELDLRIEGIFLTDQFRPSPDHAWIRDLMGPDAPVQIELSWQWDDAHQRLRIDELNVDFDGDNSVAARLTGQANGWRPHETPWADLGISSAAIDIAFDGLFEQAVAAPLRANGIDMSGDSMAFIAAGIEGLTASAPERFLPRASAAAITDFARSLPEPRGDLALSLSSRTPAMIARIAEDLGSGIAFDTAVPDGLSLDAQWTPAN